MKRGMLAMASATAIGIAISSPAPTQAQTASRASFEVVEASIDSIHMAMRSGRLTAHQLVQAYLDRISAYDKQGPNINSVITLNPNALAEADRLDAAFRTSGFVGPLHGITVLVKDEIDAAGMPTTLGTVVFKDYRPPKDAFAIDKLRKAGAIVLGKTTLSEFAAGDTYGSMFGVTRNPYDLERTVGGSSGGSGAALTANFATVTIGEETVASIRRPATWNAVVSMRPTPGLVSRTGMWDGYPTLHAQMGPMARSVRDLAKLLDGMVGYDPEDPVSALGIGKHEGSYTKYLDQEGLEGARIGILRESIGNKSDPNAPDFKLVDAAFEKNVAELKAAGATLVDPIVIPNLKKLLATRERDPVENDAALELYLARNPDSPFKTRRDIINSPDIEKSFPPPNVARYKAPMPPLNAARYVEYVRAREQLMISIAKIMADNRLDAIVHKSVEHEPSLIKNGINPPYETTRGVPTLNTFLIFAASMTVPSGFTSDGLPVGITFFGLPYSEPTLLKLAYSYEQATHHRLPPKTTPPLQ
ncbi:MAG TPA: amidase family protein [Xanthobacteraceae bacterium]|jgi:Asp-tRNA(Asn)/Glu-tRNA(Gln) amidotransferase A subunit family amidase